MTSLTARGDVEVYKETEGGAKDESRVGNTQAVDLLENDWSFSFNGKTVESTRADVQVGVGSAQHEDKDGTVDNVAEDFDTNQSGGNNERGGGSSGLLAVGNEEGGIGSWDDETDDENTTDVEDKDTPEGPPDCDWDVPPGILGLADGDTDEFGSHISEEGVDESSPETKEGSQTLPVGNLILEVFTHRTMGRIPVTETAVEEKSGFWGEVYKQIGILTSCHVWGCLRDR